MAEKIIFTFWEPKDKIPAYLELCLESWKKFLPEYEIVILDYSNLDKWLGKDFCDNYLYKTFSLAIQSDAIRCGILKKYGGLWLDVDTIFTSSNVKSILENNSDFSLITPHICFINANKNSIILDKWLKNIKRRVKLYKKAFKYGKLSKYYLKIFKNKFYKKLTNWSYLGNDIINPIISRIDDLKIYSPIDRNDLGCMPELLIGSKYNSAVKNYREFYFNSDNSDFVFAVNKGVILLHNSWTPDNYKKMTKHQFLNSKTTLANIFNKIHILN